MSIRSFIFCDICNPQGIRSIEFRRKPREDERNGRRLCDGRSWFEGDLTTALENGWMTNTEGQHICSVCKHREQ